MNRCLWVLCICAATVAANPLTIEVRLLTALRSAAVHAQDQPIEAMLIQPLIRDGQVWMPFRTRLRGTIRRASSVGIGLRHERASLDIRFTSWETPNGGQIALEATPLSIDNAREQVDKKGRIQGILAASNPLGIVRGVWYKPSANMFLRAPAGLSGGGTLWAKLALGPLGAMSLLSARLLMTRMPEPEIDLPVGTEMTLQITADALEQNWGEAPAQGHLERGLAEFLKAQPVDVRKPDKSATTDIINIALLGSEALVQESFRAAGWVTADPLDRSSFARTYKAFTQRLGYPTSPVSKLYYQGRLPDLVFQKSLNSIAKRHHIRLWRVTADDGTDVWLGAATHDVTVIFDRKNFGLSHRIDVNIDPEREKVAGDLEFAAALESTKYLPRNPDVSAGARTDGALAVMELRTANPFLDVPAGDAAAKASRVHKFARRMMLEARQYVLRENAYYLAYAAGRKIARR